MNTVHHDRKDASAEALARANLVYCETCGEVVCNSNAGRGGHARKGCGTFVSRNSRIKAVNIRLTTGFGPAHDGPTPMAHRAEARGATTTLEDISDDDFFGSRPPCVRYLRRWGWQDWVNTCMSSSLRGYGSDSVEGRIRRQAAFLQIVRQRLRKGVGKPGEHWTSDSGVPRERIEALVEVGALSRATQQLCQSSKLMQVDNACLERLRELHPHSPPLETPTSFETHSIAGVSEDEVAKAIRRKLSRGAAPGLDGWTRELLLPIVHDKEGLCELTRMLSDILNGITSEQTIARLLGCPLFPLAKDEVGGVRPIAIESTLMKVLSHVALARVSEDTWAKAFPHLQFGAGPKANLETAIHTVRERIERGQHAILVDCKNAFNTISRETIMEQLKKNPGFWPLYRLASWSLRPTPLSVLQEGKCVAKILSASGVRQGSVLGPLLFCLAIQPTLQRISSTCPNVQVAAYLDDITITSDNASDANTAFHALEQELSKIGLSVNRRKTVALVPSDTITPTDIQSTQSVTRLLGAAIWLKHSGPQEVADFVVNQMKRHDVFFERIAGSGLSAMTHLTLLQTCGIGRPTFLIRTHSCEHALDAAHHFDARLEKALTQLIGNDAQLSDIASLPCKLGGLGLRATLDIADIAYMSRERGTQRVATEELDQVKWRGVSSTLSARDQQIFKSFAQCNLRGVHVSDDALRMHLRERMFLPIALPGSTCCCSAPLDAQHVHTCPSLGAARIRRHDGIKKLLAKYAARSYVVREEPSRLISGSRARPDLLIALPDGDMHVDVSCTYMGLNVNGPLDQRAKEKQQKYASLPLFLPFVVGSTGELHQMAEAVLARLLPARAERDAARAELLGALIEGNYWLLRAAMS